MRAPRRWRPVPCRAERRLVARRGCSRRRRRPARRRCLLSREHRRGAGCFRCGRNTGFCCRPRRRNGGCPAPRPGRRCHGRLPLDSGSRRFADCSTRDCYSRAGPRRRRDGGRRARRAATRRWSSCARTARSRHSAQASTSPSAPQTTPGRLIASGTSSTSTSCSASRGMARRRSTSFCWPAITRCWTSAPGRTVRTLLSGP